MALDITKIEAFFEAKFEPQNSQPDRARDLIHFDGTVHWHLMLQESKRFLYIAADPKEVMTGFPTVEIEVTYSNSSIRESLMMQGGSVLIIRPEGCLMGSNLVVLSKLSDGKISLSTSVGQGLDDPLNKLSQEWFDNEE